MATFINVTSGGDELLNQAKRQQQAARWAHGQQNQRQLLSNEKTKQATEEAQGKSLDPLPVRRDLAAFAGDSFPAIGFFDDGNNQIITVWSGDLKESVTFDGVRKEPAPQGVFFPEGYGSAGYIDDPDGLFGAEGLVLIDGGARDGDPATWDKNEDYYSSSSSTLNGASVTFTVLSEEHNFYHQEQGATFVLPAGQDAFVYVRLQETNVTRRHSWREEVQVSTLTYRYSDYVGGESHYAHEIQQSAVPGRTVAVFRSRQVFCCLVNAKSVRKIEAPAALLSRLEYLYPSLPNPTITSPGAVFTLVTRTSYNTATSTFDVAYTTTMSYPDITANYDVSLWGDAPGYEKYTDDGLITLSLLRQFGIGNLDSTDHSGGFSNSAMTEYTASFWSPAVFSLLKNYDGSLASRSNALSYSYMRNRYLASAPRLFFDTKEDFDTDTEQYSVSFPSARFEPATLLTKLESSQLRPNKRGTRVFDGWEQAGFPSPLYVWDWGKPGYCRQQLLALGFSPADLVP